MTNIMETAGGILQLLMEFDIEIPTSPGWGANLDEKVLADHAWPN